MLYSQLKQLMDASSTPLTNKISPVVGFSMFKTHWGRETHIPVGKLTTIGSDNSLSPERLQAIIWTSAGMLSIGPLGTNFSEILIGTFQSGKCIWKCRLLNGVYFVRLSVLSAFHWRFCIVWYHEDMLYSQLKQKLRFCHEIKIDMVDDVKICYISVARNPCLQIVIFVRPHYM